MAIIARPGPVFYVFGPKISRTFWGKCTEQSSRKKLAVGGFEPEKVRLLYPAPLKGLTFVYHDKSEVFAIFHTK